jgi:hypothetical protein
MIETLRPSKANPDEFNEDTLMEEWAGDPAGAHVASQAFNEARINPDVRTLVLREEGKVKGVATYDVDLKRKELHIWWIGTDTGKGYGGKLFREMEEIADKEGVSMSTVPATEESEAWFVKHGFQKDPRVKIFVRGPRTEIKKKLASIPWTTEKNYGTYADLEDFGVTAFDPDAEDPRFHDYEFANDPAYYVMTEIPIDKLTPVQQIVHKEGVEKYLDNPELINTDNPDKAPLVILDEKGNYWLSDGNHRLAVSKLLGIKTLKVKLIRWDKKKPKPYGARGGARKKKGSKTSGWAKLKEELPSSGAVRARLIDSDHSVKYHKVLESLERYWLKRGN